MKIYVFFFLSIFSLLIQPSEAGAALNEALIIYDDGSATASYPAKQDTLANLLGHFDLPYVFKATDEYQAGDNSSYAVTFYIGNQPGANLPGAFLQDALRSDKPFVWMNFNLENLAWAKKFERRFEKSFGFRYDGILQNTAYDEVNYQDRNFFKLKDEVGQTTVLASAKAIVGGQNFSEDSSLAIPYSIKSGAFSYVSENPLEVWYDDQSYIVFADLLHDLIEIDHPQNRRALVRIEDVDVRDDPDSLKEIADYLAGESVPFGVSVIPRFTDPLGALGPPTTVDLDEAPATVDALNYMVSKGGALFMHGFTHQYDGVPNPENGVSGIDSEFWITGGPLPVGPVPEDSVEWVQGRIDSGAAIFSAAGFSRPQIWVTPHYVASQLDYGVFASNFQALNLRLENTYFPYIINQSIYGAKIIPENLGYIYFPNQPPELLIDRADKNLVVRDGFASFFFHSYIDVNHLKTTVEGLKSLGYTFVDINTLL